MRSKILIYCLTLFTVIIGCSEEKFEEEVNGMHFGIKPKNKIKFKYLNTLDSEKVLRKVDFNTSSSNSNGIVAYFKSKNTLKTNTGSIDYSESLEITDDQGFKTTSFKINEHPDDNCKTFHNFVIEETQDGIETKILKYEMTEQFYNDYLERIKYMSEFEGTVTTLNLTSGNNCIDAISNNGSGGSGGGVGGSGGSTGGTSGGGTSGGGGTTYLVCNDCFTFYPNWGSLVDSGCLPYGFSFFSMKNAVVLNSNCNDNVVGIVPPSIIDDCQKIKDYINPEKNNIKQDLIQLANLANHDSNERGRQYKMKYFYNPDTQTEYYDYDKTDLITGTPTSINFTYGGGADEDYFYTVATVHTHPSPGHTMFSFMDILGLKDTYKYTSSLLKPFVSMFIVVPNGTAYCLNIDDFELFEQKINEMIENSKYNILDEEERNRKITRDLGNEYNNNLNQLEKFFLQKFSSFGLKLSKSNQNQFSIWNELSLNSSNQVVSKPCDNN